MAFNSATERDLALKKIVGKAHTSPAKEIANESLTSGLTISSQTVFGQTIPAVPNKSAFYKITEDAVEYLQMPIVFIPGTDTDSGRHSFAVKLPDDYESNSNNPKAGIAPFVNGQVIHQSLGSLQLVPTSFGADYEAIPYYGSQSAGLDRIYPLDERDWSLDYFNGVFFQQDPPGAGDHSQNPTYVNAFIYIGDTLDAVINGLSGGSSVADGSFITIESEEGMSKERKLSIGSGLLGTDGGENSSFQIEADPSVVAILAGSTFTGDVSFNQGLSGSLQNLQDGSSYLVAGNNIQIQSGSSGQVTISTTATEGNTGFTTLILGSETLAASTSEDITFVAGEGMQITTDSSTNTLTFKTAETTTTEIIKVGNMTEEVLTPASPETLLPFILAGTPAPASSLAVYSNGVRLAPTIDFTYANTTKTVTMLGDHNINSMIVATYSEEVSGTIDENDPRLSDDRTASGIRTATTVVKASDSSAPSEGQVLVANSSTQAEWNDLLIFNEVPSGAKDDTNQDFTLSRQPMNENDIMVFVNGLLQKVGINNDISLEGNTLTFAVPPNEGDMILVTYRPNYS